MNELQGEAAALETLHAFASTLGGHRPPPAPKPNRAEIIVPTALTVEFAPGQKQVDCDFCSFLFRDTHATFAGANAPAGAVKT